ncbi:MAG: DUF1553 domain-containing protein, partial [Roseimicrobium sp.]
ALCGTTTQSQPSEWFAWYLREKDPLWREASRSLDEARHAENALAATLGEIMVMREMPMDPRPTYVLERGRFDARREAVQPGTPSSVLAFPPDFPRNRLGYARWLTDRRHPLTARVYVNRVWQQFFGRGIVGTSEDFGVQGEAPTHPELLDWLAVEFMDSGWDVKALCRRVVLSATYRQSVVPHQLALLHEDPDNKLLARGPRQRLTAEQLRDSALAVSGLLAPEMGGPPVKPYQPTGLYESSGMRAGYPQDHGNALYRRSLYTFWNRTLPPAAMTVFDAPTREFCKARRDRSATPLQALVLFNDVQFVEAARILAEKLVREFHHNDAARALTAWRLLTAQAPTPQQLEAITQFLVQERAAFTEHADEAAQFCRCGEHPAAESLPVVEVAATAALVRALFAYDDCVMKP